MYVEFQKNFFKKQNEISFFYDSGDCIELEENEAVSLLSMGIVKPLEELLPSPAY